MTAALARPEKLRPGLRRLWVYNAVGLPLTLALGVAGWDESRFNPLGLVLALCLIGFLIEFSSRSEMSARTGTRLSADTLVMVPAIALLGPIPAALCGISGALADLFRYPHEPAKRVAEFWIVSCYPMFAALLLDRVAGSPRITGHYLALVGLCFSAAVVLNYVLVSLVPLLNRDDPRALDQPPPRLPQHLQYFSETFIALQLPTLLLALLIVLLFDRFGYPTLLLALAAVGLGNGIVVRLQLAEQRSLELARLQLGVLATMTEILALRDRMTARHSATVARLGRDLALGLGLGARLAERVHIAGLLHDIGKFALPEALLFYDGELAFEDEALLELHPEIGARLVRQLAGFEDVAVMVETHHLRPDGAGYPRGLDYSEAPIGARIIAVCEAYDVLTAADSYRIPRTPQAALEELRAGIGTRYDARVVEGLAALLAAHDPAYAHGDGDSFESELSFEARVTAYARAQRSAPKLGLAIETELERLIEEEAAPR